MANQIGNGFKADYKTLRAFVELREVGWMVDVRYRHTDLPVHKERANDPEDGKEKASERIRAEYPGERVTLYWDSYNQ